MSRFLSEEAFKLLGGTRLHKIKVVSRIIPPGMFESERAWILKIKTAAWLNIFTPLTSHQAAIVLSQADGHISCWDTCIQSQDIVWETWAHSLCRSHHHHIIPSRRIETQAQGSSAESPKDTLPFIFSVLIFHYTLCKGRFWMLSCFLFMSLHLLHPGRQSKSPGHTLQ